MLRGKNLMDHRENQTYNPVKVFYQEAEDKRYKRYQRRCYGYLVVESLLFFCLGLFCAYCLKL